MIRFRAPILATALLALCASGWGLLAPDSTRAESRRQMPDWYPQADMPAAFNRIADDFVKLGLEIGTYDADYVDAYYGPPELRTAAVAAPRSRKELIAAAEALRLRVQRLTNSLPISVLTGRDLRRALRQKPSAPQPQRLEANDRARLNSLHAALTAAITRLQMKEGMLFKFDGEAKNLFATAPDIKPLSDFDVILAQLDKLIPGTGTLAERVDAFNDRYVIPKEKLKPVFDAAIAECRKRTARFIALPAGESFTLEFVTGKSWSGYNWYQGGYKSLIQVNTDLPVRISRAVDLGCHEGYPGHHVLNLMVEQKLVRGLGWKEFEINPLYSPQSVISEGSANYGIDLAFTPAERLSFERRVLYPLAGLNPASAQAYWRVQRATEELAGARIAIAKRYLDSDIDRPTAIELSQKYQLLSAARAEQSIKFLDQYRSYVINYGWGKALVKRHIEAGRPSLAERWARMERLLSAPALPEDLLVR